MSFLSGLTDYYGGLFGGVGNILNKMTGAEGQMNKSYKQQMASAQYQNAYDKYMWNLQNEYNSPSAQLARMKEAGIDINPTSYALGTGNLSNTATFAGSENGFAGSGSPAGNPISMLMGVANGIQGIKESDARVNNLVAQNDNLHVQNEATRIDNQIKRHNLTIAEKTQMPVNEAPDIWRVLGQKFAIYSKGDKEALKQFGADALSLMTYLSEQSPAGLGIKFGKKLVSKFFQLTKVKNQCTDCVVEYRYICQILFIMYNKGGKNDQ